MASKISLSKLKKRQDPGYASSLAFRFIPHEEDLEEIPSDTLEPSTDRRAMGETVNYDPAYRNFMNQKIEHCNLYQDDKPPTPVTSVCSSDSQMISARPQGSFVEAEANRQMERKKPVERAKSATFPDSQSKTSEIEHSSVGANSPEGRGSSDSSPMKESVKDLMTKLSKRSASFDCSSQILESDAWSLISGIKGKIAKTWEERRNRDISSSSLSNSSKCSDKRDSDRISVDSLDMENSTPSSESTAAAVSDYTPEAEEGCYAEIFFQTSDNRDQGSTSSGTTFSQGSPTKSSKANNNSDLFGQPKETRQMTRMPVSMTLSSLMATKSLEMDILEEDENMSPPVSATRKNSQQTLEKEISKALSSEGPLLSKKDNVKKHMSKVKEKSLQWWKICNEQSQKLMKRKVAVTGVAFLACALAPFPSYLSGFLMGFMLSALLASLLWCLFRPSQHSPSGVSSIPDRVLPRLFEIPRNGHRKDGTVIYKGWMNQLPFDYNPDTYHINMTHSIYVRLEGTSLRLSRPKYNIRKRAMWNEPHHEPSFIHQRHFDVRNASVTLLPEGLARKRLWSKKYPICITVPDFFGIAQSKIELAKDCLSSLDASPAETPLSSDEPSPINGSPDKVTLYLFARTDREKEEWFRRFETAAKPNSNSKELHHSLSMDTYDGNNQTSPRSMSVSLGVQPTASFVPPAQRENRSSIDFYEYMSLLLPPCVASHRMISQKASQEKPTLLRNVSSLTCISEEVTNNVSWLNALIGRLFYDFLTQPYWSKAVSNKIQRKLSKIKVPYFIEELTLTDIHLGNALPQICKTYDPAMDERGLWIDLDITYSGTFQMTLETKLNLMRLGKRQTIEMMEFSANEQQEIEQMPTVTRSHVYNSEEEDSAESSSDEDLNSVDPESAEESNVGSSAGKRILRIVDRIAQSRYFQQAAEYKYIKKAMEGVSNTPIMLTVEVRNLIGTLALNIPPPPTDRLWYGFRGNPKLTISARPKLGEHVVTLSPVTEWIEKKLLLEFQKLLVIPNMDDIPIPVMNSGLSRS